MVAPHRQAGPRFPWQGGGLTQRLGSDGFGPFMRRWAELWLLPLLLLAAVLGAVVATGIILLSYSSQLSALREAGPAAVGDFDTAVGSVEDRISQARAEIQQLADDARQQGQVPPPFTDPEDGGVYTVVGAEEGSGVAVLTDDGESLLLAPGSVLFGDDGVVDSVEVHVADETVSGEVHSYHHDYGLGVVRVEEGLRVADWHARVRGLEIGEPIFLVSASEAGGLVAATEVAGNSREAVIPALGVSRRSSGAALMDREGQLVAVVSHAYSPFGPEEGTLVYGAPMERLCDELLRCDESEPSARRAGSPGEHGEPPEDAAEPDAPEPAPGETAPEESENAGRDSVAGVATPPGPAPGRSG